ncbi:MAG: bifunctional oligoribonuclease/PAP phosphatase NrnA, partial [Deltaproteobacteria bacterium]|nr:bifunctional oligoribonuclease/PAP phosphatase NrnA [Deltaproteobacteria bacterium]
TYRCLPGTEEVLTEGDGPPDFQGIIILDSGHPERIGLLFKRLHEFPLVVNLDHHLPRQPWGDVSWVDAGAAAVGQMVSHLARILPARISPQAAKNLYTAILTDTGGFRHPNTSAPALALAAELVELGADPAQASNRVYWTYTPGRIKLLAEVLGSLELTAQGRVGLVEIDQAVFEATGTGPADLEGFIDYVQAVEGVEVAALMRQEKGGYKLSLRSNGRIDVAGLAARYGGGGHRLAAGMFMAQTRAQVKAALKAALKQALSA